MTPNSRRVTIRDVAALAGVGTKTVSRVINNEPHVSDEIRNRVLSAVTRLNYEPDLGASALKRSGHRTNSIGVLVDQLHSPYAAAFLDGLESQTSPRSTAILLASSHEDPDLEKAQFIRLTRRRVDGVILARGTGAVRQLLDAAAADLPIVLVDTDPGQLLVDTVSSDDYQAAAVATRHLLDQGHRRIAHLGEELSSAVTRTRHRGYNDAMSESGLATFHRELVTDDATEMSAAADRVLRQLLDQEQPPTALLTSGGAVTVGAVHALHLRHQHDQVAVVAVHDLPGADLPRPAITTVGPDHGELGRLAAQHLYSRLAGGSPDPETARVTVSITPRGSGEIPPPPDR